MDFNFAMFRPQITRFRPGHVPALDDRLAWTPQKFDWLFEHTLFCAIDPSHRDHYVAALKRWLKPEGKYVAVFYMIPDGSFNFDEVELK